MSNYAFVGCIDEEEKNEPISGNGKTLSMVGYGYLAHKKGHTIWSNFNTTFSDRICGLQEMIDILQSENTDKKLILMITEMGNIINSCGSSQNQILFIENFLRQLRKIGGDKGEVDLYYDEQRFRSLQRRLRIFTTNILMPYKYHMDNSSCLKMKCDRAHKIYVYSYKPYKVNPIKIFSAENVGRLYNTHEYVLDSLKIPKMNVLRGLK